MNASPLASLFALWGGLGTTLPQVEGSATPFFPEGFSGDFASLLDGEGAQDHPPMAQPGATVLEIAAEVDSGLPLPLVPVMATTVAVTDAAVAAPDSPPVAPETLVGTPAGEATTTAAPQLPQGEAVVAPPAGMATPAEPATTAVPMASMQPATTTALPAPDPVQALPVGKEGAPAPAIPAAPELAGEAAATISPETDTPETLLATAPRASHPAPVPAAATIDVGPEAMPRVGMDPAPVEPRTPVAPVQPGTSMAAATAGSMDRPALAMPVALESSAAANPSPMAAGKLAGLPGVEFVRPIPTVQPLGASQPAPALPAAMVMSTPGPNAAPAPAPTPVAVPTAAPVVEAPGAPAPQATATVAPVAPAPDMPVAPANIPAAVASVPLTEGASTLRARELDLRRTQRPVADSAPSAAPQAQHQASPAHAPVDLPAPAPIAPLATAGAGAAAPTGLGTLDGLMKEVAEGIVRGGRDALLSSARPVDASFVVQAAGSGPVEVALQLGSDEQLHIALQTGDEDLLAALEADADQLVDAIEARQLRVAELDFRGQPGDGQAKGELAGQARERQDERAAAERDERRAREQHEEQDEPARRRRRPREGHQLDTEA